MTNDTAHWAQENFGSAKLGDPRRVARLVAMAQQAARSPAGRVTEVFESSAEREGAFRLLENAAVSSERVAESVFDATAERCSAQGRVYVALDGSSLTLTDRTRRRELGPVGKRWPSRGLHVMSALGVDERGATVGLLGQKWWTLPEKRPKRNASKCFGLKYLERTTRYWVDALEEVSQRLRERAPNTTGWYQLDRGADCWPVLSLAVERQLLITVRSSHDRRLLDERGRRAYLRKTLGKHPLLGHYELELPARPDRPARTARMALRACSVTLLARVGSKKWRPIPVNAILAEEEGHRSKGRLRWILLTTAPVSSFKYARAAVHGYSLRWRVEEFHRAWKRGLCRVEESQLQSRSALIKWATILGAVAARALRIARTLRTTPNIPADEEFSQYEIAATFALAKRRLDRRRRIRFKELVDMIADLGGFANKYSGGRPGPTVVGRGLQKVTVIALALKNLDEMR
jgi:hypothetical protein